jgi:branched-chain amino acid aminotransferase
LLRDAGETIEETTLRYDDFDVADEIFTTGNYSKVMPVLRMEERDLQAGPVFVKARKLYWEFAHANKL